MSQARADLAEQPEPFDFLHRLLELAQMYAPSR